MALNNVKELTVPVNGTSKAVKKIEDSNGNIIWGSQSAFPYRRLEYLQGDGVNYVITNTTVNTAAEYWFEMAFASGQANALSGAEETNSYSTNDRFKFGTSAGGTLYCGYANGFASQTPVENRFYEFYVKKGSQYIKDMETGTTLATKTYSLTGSHLGTGHVTLFGISRTSDSEISNISNNAGTRIKKYTILYNGNYAYFIPVQRKSDGKCGFYNTRSKTFIAETGSGALIPGPVVDEYWDLTA